MKKIFSIAMTAALVFGLTSCSKEIDNGVDNTEINSAMQFTVKTQKGNLVTYADIATTPEWVVNAVDAYIFDDAGDLIGSSANTADFTVTADGGTTTITATNDWLSANKGKSVEVYFVGNNAVANMFGEVSHIDNTVVTKEAFIEQLTVRQALDAGDENRAELLNAPLLFSASAATVVPTVGKVNIPVSLKRREARFDIVNTIPADFVIDKVIVKNANIEGYIFADAAGNAAMTRANLKEITTIPAYDADGLAASVFYLYPTRLGVGLGTEISVIATVNGEQNAYPINSSAKIDANKRYKLVLDPATLVFTVVVADYDEGDDLAVAPMDQLTLNGAISSGSAFWDDINNLIYVEPNTGAHVFDFTVYASSKKGVNVAVEDIFGGQQSLFSVVSNTTQAVVTYSGIGYKTDVKINIAEYTGTESFQSKITIKDKMFGAEAKITAYYDNGQPETVSGGFTYPGTDLQAVKVGDYYWAPVNVGASAVLESGLFFQWGRNVGFRSDVSYNVSNTAVPYADGEAINDAIIIGRTNIDKWYSEATDPADTWFSFINSGTTKRDLCPKGYRMPSINDMISIFPARSTNFYNTLGVFTEPNIGGSYTNQITDNYGKEVIRGNGSNTGYIARTYNGKYYAYKYINKSECLEIRGLELAEDPNEPSLAEFAAMAWEESDVLIIPRTGYIRTSLGNTNCGYLWTSSYAGGDGRAYLYILNVNYHTIATQPTTNSFPVRCIKEA